MQKLQKKYKKIIHLMMLYSVILYTYFFDFICIFALYSSYKSKHHAKWKAYQADSRLLHPDEDRV